MRATCVPPHNSVENAPILQYAHFVAVFLAEQCQRAEVERVLVRHLTHFRFDVASDLGVDQVLYAPQLVRAEGLEMREVETQTIRRNQRAFLLHMRAQHLTQRRVQEMRRRVIEHCRLTAPCIDARERPLRRRATRRPTSVPTWP